MYIRFIILLRVMILVLFISQRICQWRRLLILSLVWNFTLKRIQNMGSVLVLQKRWQDILVSRERLSKLNEYDKEEEDITSEYWIDLYGDREKRCGPDFHKYIDKIEEYTETEYVKKLCAFFSDDTIFCSHIIREFSVKKIMENYEV